MMVDVILLGIIILLIVLHHFERRDLYNRIMSKNLTEYKGEKSRYTPSAHQSVLQRWRRKDGEKD